MSLSNVAFILAEIKYVDQEPIHVSSMLLPLHGTYGKLISVQTLTHVTRLRAQQTMYLKGIVTK